VKNVKTVGGPTEEVLTKFSIIYILHHRHIFNLYTSGNYRTTRLKEKIAVIYVIHVESAEPHKICRKTRSSRMSAIQSVVCTVGSLA
jgi:hypothetical protein